MKTLPVRQLLREPSKVKKLTAAGESVRITDRGGPLWITRPVAQEEKESSEVKMARDRWLEEEFDAMSKEPISKLSLAKIIDEGRR